MKQKDKAQKLTGEQGFIQYYSQIYSDWDQLKEALLKDNIHTKLDAGGTESYFLDPGSIAAALCLNTENAQKILDLCAAPGGKSLIISQIMDDSCQLFSNERSPERKNRLAKVIQTCLSEKDSQKVTVSCSDGALWCKKETEAYDSILLDAPCSSERHVLTDPKYLKDWTPSRIKSLSMEQWALISSAWRLLKPEGYLLYSTCSLAPQENDEIITRLLKKFDDVQVISLDSIKEIFCKNLNKISSKLTMQSDTTIEEVFETAVKTQHGLHVLPHYSKGAGPLYFTLLKKSR